jgi:hypothetical protein
MTASLASPHAPEVVRDHANRLALTGHRERSCCLLVVVLLLFHALLGAGCAPQPGRHYSDIGPQLPPVRPDRARLFIYWLWCSYTTLDVNGSARISLNGPYRFAVVDLPSGTHEISVYCGPLLPPAHRYIMVLAGGEERYLQVLALRGPRFVLVTREKGREDLRRCRLASARLPVPLVLEIEASR